MKNFAHFDRSTLPHEEDEGTMTGVKGGKSRALREKYERKDDEIPGAYGDTSENTMDITEDELYDQI